MTDIEAILDRHHIAEISTADTSQWLWNYGLVAHEDRAALLAILSEVEAALRLGQKEQAYKILGKTS